MHNRVGGVFAGALFALCGLGIVGAIQLAVQKASETGQIISKAEAKQRWTTEIWLSSYQSQLWLELGSDQQWLEPSSNHCKEAGFGGGSFQKQKTGRSRKTFARAPCFLFFDFLV